MVDRAKHILIESVQSVHIVDSDASGLRADEHDLDNGLGWRGIDTGARTAHARLSGLSCLSSYT